MTIKNASKLFIGSVCVYVAMAACVASEHTPIGSTATTGTNGAGGSMVSSAGMAGMGGIFDPVPDAGAETSGSGSRLKARRYVADDGARSDQIGHWYDSARKEDCAFRRASDGAIRCIPMLTYALSFYADDQCTQQIVSPSYGKPACSEDVKYAHTYDQNIPLCSNIGVRVHAFGSPTVPTWVHFKKSDGACVIYSGLETSVTDWHTIGPEIPPSEFVAATLVTDP
jgi:hypothetical protein